VKEAKNRVDPDATEDRAAVTAVRSAVLRPPESKPPNLGKMSWAEFDEYKKSLGL
jgi:hypothetical protein